MARVLIAVLIVAFKYQEQQVLCLSLPLWALRGLAVEVDELKSDPSHTGTLLCTCSRVPIIR